MKATIHDGLRVRLKTRYSWWSEAAAGTGPPEKDVIIPEGATGTLREFIHGGLWLTMTDDSGKTKPYFKYRSAVYATPEEAPERFEETERRFGIEFDEYPYPQNQPGMPRVDYCRIIGDEGDPLPDYLEPQ